LTDLLKLCRSLNDAGANYIVIGGMAMVQAGFVRATEDIDLLIDPSAPEGIVEEVGKGGGGPVPRPVRRLSRFFASAGSLAEWWKSFPRRWGALRLTCSSFWERGEETLVILRAAEGSKGESQFVNGSLFTVHCLLFTNPFTVHYSLFTLHALKCTLSYFPDIDSLLISANV
jgi:hypothetical protein